MVVLELLIGLLLMLGFYIASSLMGVMLMSFISKKTVQILHYILSIQERIRKQGQQFLQKKQAIEKKYRSKKNRVIQKTSNQQQSLFNANTKAHIHHLAQQTRKQLLNHQNQLSPENQYLTKQAVKQCVNELDMEGLIKINLSLSSQRNNLPYSLQRSESHQNNNPL